MLAGIRKVRTKSLPEIPFLTLLKKRRFISRIKRKGRKKTKKLPDFPKKVAFLGFFGHKNHPKKHPSPPTIPNHLIGPIVGAQLRRDLSRQQIERFGEVTSREQNVGKYGRICKNIIRKCTKCSTSLSRQNLVFLNKEASQPAPCCSSD